MAVNPDPKPGRWILPLVVLGMIAFTYFFVRELPEASTETTLVPAGSATTTGGAGGGDTDGSTTTTQPQQPLDPTVQAYLDEIDTINQELQVQRTELVTVNEAFNQDPREVEFAEAEDRFEAVQAETQNLANRQSDLTPPDSLAPNHQSLVSAIDLASSSITEALEGLRSTDEGQQRNSAVEAFVQASADYDTEVTNTHNAAGSTPADGGNGETTETTTGDGTTETTSGG
jgi:hypothetical protein